MEGCMRKVMRKLNKIIKVKKMKFKKLEIPDVILMSQKFLKTKEDFFMKVLD